MDEYGQRHQQQQQQQQQQRQQQQPATRVSSSDDLVDHARQLAQIEQRYCAELKNYLASNHYLTDEVQNTWLDVADAHAKLAKVITNRLPDADADKELWWLANQYSVLSIDVDTAMRNLRARVRSRLSPISEKSRAAAAAKPADAKLNAYKTPIFGGAKSFDAGAEPKPQNTTPPRFVSKLFNRVKEMKVSARVGEAGAERVPDTIPSSRVAAPPPNAVTAAAAAAPANPSPSPPQKSPPQKPPLQRQPLRPPASQTKSSLPPLLPPQRLELLPAPSDDQHPEEPRILTPPSPSPRLGAAARPTPAPRNAKEKKALAPDPPSYLAAVSPYLATASPPLPPNTLGDEEDIELHEEEEERAAIVAAAAAAASRHKARPARDETSTRL